MKKRLIKLSEAVSFPVPRELTPEEEAAILAEYKAERTPEALDADYQDFEKQFAEGVPAEQFLQELEEGSATE